jgi:hypothetical protein
MVGKQLLGPARWPPLAIRACQAGHWVLFATAAEWVARLADAHDHSDGLDDRSVVGGRVRRRLALGAGHQAYPSAPLTCAICEGRSPTRVAIITTAVGQHAIAVTDRPPA